MKTVSDCILIKCSVFFGHEYICPDRESNPNVRYVRFDDSRYDAVSTCDSAQRH